MSCNGSGGKDTSTEHFLIHVGNLPADLDKDGIRSMFAQYGNVTGVSVIKNKIPGTNSAYISYSKYTDAEQAFKALNKQPPLQLQIQIKGKKSQVNYEPEPQCDLSRTDYDWRYQDNNLENAVRGKKLIDAGRAHASPGYRPPIYTSDDDILYNVPTDSSIFNPYEPPGPYRETNLMYTRGVAHVTKDGRRHVSFGRGYTHYNLPEPHYNISTYVQNVADRREKDIYEYAPDAEDEEIGKCRVCSEATPFMCHKCSVTYYCSRRCQQKDWNDHKNECQPIPPLVKKIRGKSLDRRNHDIPEVSQKHVENDESSQKPPLRRPKTSESQSMQQQQRQQTPPRDIIIDTHHNRSSPRTQQNGQVTSSVKSTPSKDEHVKDLNMTQIPVGTFKVESTSFPAKQPQQKQPPPQQLPYQKHQQQQQQIQQQQMQSSPPQAQSPRGFCAPRPKAVTPDKTLTEQMATCNLNSEQPSEKELAYAKIANLPNVLNKLEVNTIGSIIVGARIAETEFSITLVPDASEFELLIDDLRTASIDMLQKNPNYCPKMGEFVSGQDGEDWYRGIVVSTSPKVQFAVIDECRICTPRKCVPLPDQFRNINTLGLSCQFLKGTKLPNNLAERLANGAFFKATEFTGPSKDSALIEISDIDGNHIGTAGVKRWEPKPEQKGIQQVALKSGVEVIITDSTDQNLIYVRSHDPIENDRFHLLEQDIARYAQNRKRLSQAPIVGQMVLAKYVDDNFYRALVINVEGHLVVKFVDYGNEEEVVIDGLFELPDKLKEFPSAVTKISLKDVEKNVPMTKEARDYINELIGHAVPLICTFNGHHIEDGVYLKTPKNEIVNSVLNDLLKPTWEKENPQEEKKVYGIESLPAIKLGNVGEEVQAIVLSYMPEAALFVLGPNDEVAVEAIQVQMTEKAKEYVKKTTTHYIPRNNELCIAKYGDEYYRGLCMVSSLSPIESQVFFIDYGNTERVLHKDIRPITEDFLSIGAFGTICTITTLVDMDKLSEQVSECIMKHAPSDELITIKILSVGDDESLDIDIPELRVKLIEEGFL